MTFARVHKWVTYLIAGLGLYGLSLGAGLSPLALGLTAAAFVLSWFAERPLIDEPLWGRGWTVLVVGFFLVGVVRAFMRESMLTLALEYVAFLQISRLMNRRTGKDHDQIVGLAFLHLIAATILTTSIAYGLVFLAVLVAAPWMLTITHLRREVEESPPEAEIDAEAVLAQREVVGSRFLLTTALLTIPIFFTTVGLFLSFPRVGLGLATVRGFGGQPTSGFGKNVELGGFGTIREDPTVVLRVTAPVEALGPVGTAVIRMRGTSFDVYDGDSWHRSEGHSVELRQDFGAYPIVRHPDRAADFEYKVILDRLDESVVFLPEGAVALTVPARVSRGKDIARKIRVASGFDFRYEATDDQGFSYSAYVSRDRREWRKGSLSPAHAEHLLKLPKGVERVAALAQKLTAGARRDRDKATILLNYLRDSGEFRYSLSLPKTEGRNPLDVFVMEAKAGHCEYFSTAMAIMLRAVGVPTRYVTGFLGGAYNTYGGYYALRQADAHSWLEAWIDDRWVTLDPTPPARNQVGPPPSVLSPLRDFLDAVKTRWARQVVGYNLRTQTDAIRKAFSWAYRFKNLLKKPSGRGAGENRDPAPDSSHRLRGTLEALLPVVLVLLVSLALLAWYLARRGARALDDVPPRARTAVALYRELEAALRARGVPRPPEVTPSEHVAQIRAAARARGRAFEGLEEAGEITERYLRARYGEEFLSLDEARRFREKLAKVRGGPREELPSREGGTPEA